MTAAEHADAFNAGLEAAAQWHDAEADRLRALDPWSVAVADHRADAARIRSLRVQPDIRGLALGAVSGNSASVWQDGPEPVYAPEDASEREVKSYPITRPWTKEDGTGYWNPSILDRLRGWLW
jgi:hypothetical protein